MTLRKLANNKETAAKMIEAEVTISTSGHHYFGEEEVKRERGRSKIKLIEGKRAEEKATN